MAMRVMARTVPAGTEPGLKGLLIVSVGGHAGSLPRMPIAIVTGGNSGIGRAAAVALAERGLDVGITWHSEEERAEDALEEIRGHGVRAASRHMDLDEGYPDDASAIDELMDELDGIDALVNNAGAGLMSPFLELDLETWTRTHNLVLNGAFLCAQKAARHMVDQGRGGRIVNVTSVHEHVPLSDSAPYVAAKHGLGGLTKQMALELGPHAITVNAVAPGETATRMTGQEDEDPHGEERPGVPLRRPGDAREIAAVIAFLCSPESSYVTGASYVVDGGMVLMAAMANQLAG
jgi:NAD(P)-dependent dehydrogenase (short-subunit alcohol dehydrogenase family)